MDGFQEHNKTARQLNPASFGIHVDLNLIPLKKQVNVIWLSKVITNNLLLERRTCISAIYIKHIIEHEEEILKRWKEATRTATETEEERNQHDAVHHILLEWAKRAYWKGNMSVKSKDIEMKANDLKDRLLVPKFRIRSDFWDEFIEFKLKELDNYTGPKIISLDIVNILKDCKQKINPDSYEAFFKLLVKRIVIKTNVGSYNVPKKTVKTSDRNTHVAVDDSIPSVVTEDADTDNDDVILIEEKAMECIDVDQESSGDNDVDYGNDTWQIFNQIINVKSEHGSEEGLQEQKDCKTTLDEHILPDSRLEQHIDGDEIQYGVLLQSIQCIDTTSNSKSDGTLGLKIKTESQNQCHEDVATNEKPTESHKKPYDEAAVDGNDMLLTNKRPVKSRKAENAKNLDKVHSGNRKERNDESSPAKSKKKKFVWGGRLSYNRKIRQKIVAGTKAKEFLKCYQQRQGLAVHSEESSGEESGSEYLNVPNYKNGIDDEELIQSGVVGARDFHRKSNLTNESLRDDYNDASPSIGDDNELSEHNLLDSLIYEWAKRYIMNCIKPQLKPPHVVAKVCLLKEKLNLPTYILNLKVWNDIFAYKANKLNLNRRNKRVRLSMDIVKILREVEFATSSRTYLKFLNILKNRVSGETAVRTYVKKSKDTNNKETDGYYGTAVAAIEGAQFNDSTSSSAEYDSLPPRDLPSLTTLRVTQELMTEKPTNIPRTHCKVKTANDEQFPKISQINYGFKENMENGTEYQEDYPNDDNELLFPSIEEDRCKSISEHVHESDSEFIYENTAMDQKANKLKDITIDDNELLFPDIKEEMATANSTDEDIQNTISNIKYEITEETQNGPRDELKDNDEEFISCGYNIKEIKQEPTEDDTNDSKPVDPNDNGEEDVYIAYTKSDLENLDDEGDENDSDDDLEENECIDVLQIIGSDDDDSDENNQLAEYMETVDGNANKNIEVLQKNDAIEVSDDEVCQDTDVTFMKKLENSINLKSPPSECEKRMRPYERPDSIQKRMKLETEANDVEYRGDIMQPVNEFDASDAMSDNDQSQDDEESVTILEIVSDEEDSDNNNSLFEETVNPKLMAEVPPKTWRRSKPIDPMTVIRSGKPYRFGKIQKSSGQNEDQAHLEDEEEQELIRLQPMDQDVLSESVKLRSNPPMEQPTLNNTSEAVCYLTKLKDFFQRHKDLNGLQLVLNLELTFFYHDLG